MQAVYVLILIDYYFMMVQATSSRLWLYVLIVVVCLVLLGVLALVVVLCIRKRLFLNIVSCCSISNILCVHHNSIFCSYKSTAVTVVILYPARLNGCIVSYVPQSH